MKKPHILLLYTGGTIGMVNTDQGYQPHPGFLEDFLTRAPALTHADLPTYDIQTFDPLIDSANMQPAYWQKIAATIADHYMQYDGFVVLHGTDTMAYSASALSFLLEHLGKPVILTGAQIPLCQLRTDGLKNITNSLLIATQYKIPEVCVYFNNHLLRGNRTTKTHANALHAFDSPNYPTLGEVGIEITFKSHLVRPQPQHALAFSHSTATPTIASVQIFPGMQATIIDALVENGLDGLVLNTYGTGNAPASDHLFLAALQRAHDAGVIMVNCSQCLQGHVDMSGYVTGHALADVGVISGQDMTQEAALTKLSYLFSQELDRELIKQKIMESLCGELTES